ncbi:MAG: hypothetical protein JWL90_4440 [Chthoniobacteraceae bacterium]|nr:hypothetical protein [Chthoniobacteraceae bacterium]
MAWQLIYTSAPRSLEAGRSGFGTVARHRAISPLLVSAIERASQFSRLPGADAGRVIFCYRLIAVAGARYPVLSAIRDAGADYTGRTNHIAHHLIADPREIAQLGANGPSPADLLLAMKWAASWSEAPRYFETAEEVALAAIRPQSTGAGWAKIAGNANHAWLLASGDASRGAYIIQPEGVNLRALFAESLRLMPERLWQTSFTTSLQPSDEPGDFRWIGIEERSSLRSQIETSGRPILNLASPDTLPSIEGVVPANANPVRQNASLTPSRIVGREAAPGTTVGATPQRPEGTVREPVENGRGERMPRNRRTRWLLAATLIGLCVVLMTGLLFVKPWVQRRNARKEVAAIFMSSGYFPNDACLGMAAALVPGPDASYALRLATASTSLTRKLLEGSVAGLDSEETAAELEVLEHRGGAQLPEELGELRETIKHARQLSHLPSGFDQSRDTAAQVRGMDERRDEISKLLLLKKPLQRLVQELQLNADRQQAAALLATLEQRLPPPEGAAFERTVESVAAKLTDTQALQTIKTIKQILRDKSRIKTADPTPPPAATAEFPPPEEKPEARLQVPLYFLKGKESLSNFHIRELGPGLKYFLKLNPAAKTIELIDLNKNGTLRRSVAGAADFEVNETKKEIALGSGAASLTPPFRISGQSNTELFQLWICATAGGPLFPPRTEGIRRKGNLLELTPALLGFTGTPRNPLYIKLPASCSATKAASDPQPLINWSVDLSSARNAVEAQSVQWEQKRAELEQKLAEPPKDERVTFAELAAQVEKEAKFNDVDRKRDFPPANSSTRQKCGGYLLAISRLLNNGGEPVFKAGDAMKALNPDTSSKSDGEVIKSATVAVDDAIRMLRTNEEKKAYGAALKGLQQMLALLQPETTEAKAAHAASIQEAKKTIESLNTKLSQIHPLVGERVPPGDYQVFARDGGADLLLVELRIP